MSKSISKNIKDVVEEPLLDKSGESLKKLISKGKKAGFLLRNECEQALENEKFDEKEEFFSKVESLNIQIYEEDTDAQSLEEEKNNSSKEIEKEQQATQAAEQQLKQNQKRFNQRRDSGFKATNL